MSILVAVEKENSKNAGNNANRQGIHVGYLIPARLVHA